MKVLIDADGCPVVDITISLARKYGIECIIICDTSHEFRREGASTVIVSKGADSVDFVLVNMLQNGDIVITQDYGLAAMCLARGAYPVSQNGMVYNSGNIEMLLQQRYTAKKIRNAGWRLKGSSKRKSEQNTAFEAALEEILLQRTNQTPFDPELLIGQLYKVIQYYKLPNADFCWSHYNSANEAIADMEGIIAALKNSDYSVTNHLALLFAPTGSVQEISISSGWGGEFINISEIIDAQLKKLSFNGNNCINH